MHLTQNMCQIMPAQQEKASQNYKLLGTVDKWFKSVKFDKKYNISVAIFLNKIKIYSIYGQ